MTGTEQQTLILTELDGSNPREVSATIQSFDHQYDTEAKFALAMHVRAAAKARDHRDNGNRGLARWAAKDAREWLAVHLYFATKQS